MRGVHAMLYALFDAEERLDRAMMQRQVELCLHAGVAGIAALGLATEGTKLTFAERLTLMDWVVEDVRGRVPLGFTIIGASVAEQIAQLRHAESLGATWAILQPPAVGHYDAEQYLNFFGRVMQATSLPIAIQNAPQYLGRGLLDAHIARLRADHANFTLIKSESSAAEVATLIGIAPDLMVFNGRGGQQMIECLEAGCSGFLLAPDAVDHTVRIMKAYDAGEKRTAEALYAQILPSIDYVMASIEQLICYGKRVFATRAGLPVFDRAPAQRPDAIGLAEVARLANSLGSFARL